MAILVTGAAGFIGSHLCRALLDRGERVVGVDCLTDYYAPQLKRDRLDRLSGRNGFSFHLLDITDAGALASTVQGVPIRRVLHMAAQPGVRYSMENPLAYVHANLLGQVAMLEFCRHLEGLEHLVYASSSSVYGGSHTVPFREDNPADRPRSLYAATKRADELMAHSYAHLFRIPMTGVRFFTVYGPWGRPDMAVWQLSEAILEGRPLRLAEGGRVKRDFTFIDDAVAGVLRVLDRPPADGGSDEPHRIYNLGRSQPETLSELVTILEKAIGRQVEHIDMPLPAGDVPVTCADGEAMRRDHGFVPQTPIAVGLPRFVEWFRAYRGA